MNNQPMSEFQRLFLRYVEAKKEKMIEGVDICPSCKRPFPDERRCTGSKNEGKICYACYVSRND